MHFQHSWHNHGWKAIPNNNLAAAGFAISPVAANLFASKFYPLPQIDASQRETTFSTIRAPNHTDQGDLRIDYIISTKDHLFGAGRRSTCAILPSADAFLRSRFRSGRGPAGQKCGRGLETISSAPTC